MTSSQPGETGESMFERTAGAKALELSMSGHQRRGSGGTNNNLRRQQGPEHVGTSRVRSGVCKTLEWLSDLSKVT